MTKQKLASAPKPGEWGYAVCANRRREVIVDKAGLFGRGGMNRGIAAVGDQLGTMDIAASRDLPRRLSVLSVKRTGREGRLVSVGPVAGRDLFPEAGPFPYVTPECRFSFQFLISPFLYPVRSCTRTEPFDGAKNSPSLADA